MASTYSVNELKERPQAIFDEARASKEPVFIEQGGNASIVVIDADTYLNKMQALGEFERIYRDTTKPTAPIKAQTEEAKEKPMKEPVYAWRCKVCGYIEYVDELPDDFTCPICSAGKEMFERVEIEE